MGWLTERLPESRSTEKGPLQIMYGVEGRTELPEEVLGHYLLLLSRVYAMNRTVVDLLGPKRTVNAVSEGAVPREFAR